MHITWKKVGDRDGGVASGVVVQPQRAVGSNPGIDVSALIADTILASPLLRWLRSDSLQRLASSAELRWMDRGETLYREGDPIDGIYVLLSGAVVLTKQSRRGSLVLQAGSVIGGGAPSGRSASAIADTPAVLLRIPNGLFTILCRHEPTLRERLRQCVVGHKRPS